MIRRFIGLAAFMVLSSPAASASCPARSKLPDALQERIEERGGETHKYVYQTFPGPDGEETAWLVGYAHEANRAIFINEAYFKPGRGQTFVKVLGAGTGLVDVYVPYARVSEDGERTRFWDFSETGGSLDRISEAEKGQCGHLIEPTVGLEVKERDLLWKQGNEGARGHEIVLWGAQNAGNYDYLVYYHFLDDGRVQFRAAATAQNLPGNEHVLHLHTAAWRINVDVSATDLRDRPLRRGDREDEKEGEPRTGDGNDTAYLARYVEREGEVEPKAELVRDLFGGGKEGFADWNAREFTSIIVRDKDLKNANGSVTEFVVSGAYKGVARHELPNEEFFQHDFWVTRHKGDEFLIGGGMSRYANDEPIVESDVVVWMQSAILHEHRDEDGACEEATNATGCPSRWEGLALAMPTPAIEILPRNLFDTTPLYVPSER